MAGTRMDASTQKRLVLCNGCFDLLHPGHIAHLEEARAFGDRLTVALTLDKYVGKPKRPIFTWEERFAMLMALKCVDDVIATRNAVEAIYAWRPAIFVKGTDYATNGLLGEEVAACEEVGALIRFTKAQKQSTTELIARIKCMS